MYTACGSANLTVNSIDNISFQDCRHVQMNQMYTPGLHIEY